MLSNKFKSQHNETILSLKYCKLIREQSKNAKEWMGNLRIRQINVGIKKRKLEEHFTNIINDNYMMAEIIRDLTIMKKTNEIISKQV